MSEGDVRELPYSIDFDGVLAESVWPDRGIGAPIDENIEKLKLLVGAGHQVAIHTSRPWSDKAVLERWLTAHHIPYDEINMGKFLAIRYIDDRAVNSTAESWL